MYHETTLCKVFTCNKKRTHEIFLKSKLELMQLKTSISILAFTKCFLCKPPQLCKLQFHQILMPGFVSFSNTNSFQCFVLQQPKQNKSFKSLSNICPNRQCTEPGYWFYLAKRGSREKHCTTKKSCIHRHPTDIPRTSHYLVSGTSRNWVPQTSRGRPPIGLLNICFSSKKQQQMCKTRTIASKKNFFH